MRTAAGLEFLDYCAGESDIARVIERFLETIKVFGFDVCAAGAWVGVGGTREHRFYFNNWPKDWFDLYREKGFFETDPMVFETLRRMTTFLWSEISEARGFTPEGRVVFAAFKAYGWSEVMGVPVHGPSGYQGLVSMASLKPLTLTPSERGVLRAMALAVHDLAHASVGYGEGMRSRIDLTRREADCMRWVAAGKTDAEIGIILGIATATAHYHVEHVKKKAGTRSRSEAVALLVLAGAI
jgi:LuxR family quorum sensing-dependent transcriptional regulator